VNVSSISRGSVTRRHATRTNMICLSSKAYNFFAGLRLRTIGSCIAHSLFMRLHLHRPVSFEIRSYQTRHRSELCTATIPLTFSMCVRVAVTLGLSFDTILAGICSGINVVGHFNSSEIGSRSLNARRGHSTEYKIPDGVGGDSSSPIPTERLSNPLFPTEWS